MSKTGKLYGPYATADQVAFALVMACRIVGEDPADVCQGVFPSLARWYASEALKQAFPLVNRSAISRSVGSRRARTQVSSELMDAVRDHKWQTRFVYDIAVALRKTFPPERDRLVNQQRDDLTSGLMGDPAPGRSALEQRQ